MVQLEQRPSPPTLGSPHCPPPAPQGRWADGAPGLPCSPESARDSRGPSTVPADNRVLCLTRMSTLARDPAAQEVRGRNPTAWASPPIHGLADVLAAGSAPSRGGPGSPCGKICACIAAPPRDAGPGVSPCPSPIREGTSLTTRDTCRPARSGSVLPPRSSSRSLGGVAECWG